MNWTQINVIYYVVEKTFASDLFFAYSCQQFQRVRIINLQLKHVVKFLCERQPRSQTHATCLIMIMSTLMCASDHKILSSKYVEHLMRACMTALKPRGISVLLSISHFLLLSFTTPHVTGTWILNFWIKIFKFKEAFGELLLSHAGKLPVFFFSVKDKYCLYQLNKTTKTQKS